MLDHHRRTIDRAAAHFRTVPEVLAVIVGGSVARGTARPDSDVDLILVTTASEFARRTRENAYGDVSRDFHDHEGGYVDLK
jgi:predicted nucleotidyltransferase